MIDAQLERAMDRGFEIILVCRRDFLRRHVLPFELEAHSTTREHWHRESRAAKASVFHRAQYVRRVECSATVESGDFHERAMGTIQETWRPMRFLVPRAQSSLSR